MISLNFLVQRIKLCANSHIAFSRKEGEKMKAFIEPPNKLPFFINLGLFFTKRATGKDLLPPKLLAWYPKAAISSGVMEALVAHGHPSKDLSVKILDRKSVV